MADGYCKGVSLVELMVVVMVLGILASTAYPLYRDAMMRGRRGDAIASLLRLHLLQEKWRASDIDYATLSELGWSSGESADGHYRIRIRERSAAAFLATATPKVDGPQAGDPCGTFAVDQEGAVFAPGYADAACWKR